MPACRVKTESLHDPTAPTRKSDPRCSKQTACNLLAGQDTGATECGGGSCGTRAARERGRRSSSRCCPRDAAGRW